MKLDDRIQHHADQLRAAYAHRAPEPPEPRSRRTGLLVAVGAAVVAIAVIAPVALLTRSGDDPVPSSVAGSPETTTEPGPTTTEAGPTTTASPPQFLPPLFDAAALDARPEVELPGSRSPGVVTQAGDSAFFVSGSRAFESDDRGGTWKETDPLPNGDLIGPIAASEQLVIVIGAHDGATSRVYVSANPWDGWELVDLPVAGDVVQVVPHTVAVLDGEYAVAGAVTRSTFDEDVQLSIWRSPDGLAWSHTSIADLGSDFIFAEAIIDGPDGIIVLAETFSDRLLAFTATQPGWSMDELLPTLATEAGIGRTTTNTFLVDARVEGTQVSLRYAFRDNLGPQGILAGGLVRYTSDFGWEAERMVGAIPAAVVRTGDGWVGVRFPDPVTIPGSSSAITVSADGLTWREVATFPNVDLTSIVAGSDLDFYVAGSTTERIEATGGTEWTGAGLWRLELADTLAALTGQ